MVSHWFDSVENGFDTFFDLDAAVTRIRFIYGISDAVNIGVSRSYYQKVNNVSLNYRLFRLEKNGFFANLD